MLNWNWSISENFQTEGSTFVSRASSVVQIYKLTAINLKWSFKCVYQSPDLSLAYRIILDGISIFEDTIHTSGFVENSISIALTEGCRIFNFQFASSEANVTIQVQDLKISLEEENIGIN
jgi:hypothetical protein